MEKGKSKNFRKKKFQKREKPEFDQKMIDLARVTRVVKGGRRFSFRASVVIGNRRGKVGFGVAKGGDVSVAIGKAVVEAKKNMINVKRTNTTIAFDIKEKYGAARVMLRPAKEGRGVVAGGAMRAVIELAGIKDVVAKSLGSSNKLNVAKATMKALETLGQQTVKERKIDVKDMKGDGRAKDVKKKVVKGKNDKKNTEGKKNKEDSIK
jgi:small subunit ribosomal protein S5